MADTNIKTTTAPLLKTSDVIGDNPGGTYGDVVNSYAWHVPANNHNNKNVPRIILTEYQQLVASIEASLDYWAYQGQAAEVLTAANDLIKAAPSIAKNLGKGNLGEAISELKVMGGKVSNAVTDPYHGLYQATATGIKYTLPFYNTYHHQVTNQWGENSGWDNILADSAEKYLVPATRVAKPSTGIQKQRIWQGGNQQSYSFKFQLLNTVGDENWGQNKQLINALIEKQLPYVQNAVASYPPVIYTVNIPGVRICPAAAITSLTVENIGHLSYINGENIPDAYEVTIFITELISESRQLLNAEDKITTAVADDVEISKYIEDLHLQVEKIKEMNRSISSDNRKFDDLSSGGRQS